MEAIDIRQGYIAWLQPRYEDDSEISSDDVVVEALEGQEPSQQNDQQQSGNAANETLDATPSIRSYEGEHFAIQGSVLSYSKQPSIENVPQRILVDDFWARNFFNAAKKYLRKQRAQGHHLKSIVDHDKFHIYTRLKVHLMSILDPDERIQDVVHAMPGKGKGLLSKLRENASFSTVLIRVPDGK